MGDVVGLLHPGAMGAAVGAQLVASGTRTLWVSTGRGEATRRRAGSAGLEERAEIGELAECEVIISVCPPAAAKDVAAAAAGAGFRGVYVDANAISPRHVQEIDALFRARGGVVVDGGIVGPPPMTAGTTRLYLSGPREATAQVATMFAPTVLEPIVLDGTVGKASALKLAFATYNKLTFALAAHSYSLASSHGVEGELQELAKQVLPDTPLGRPDAIVSAGQRAWRWEGEMAEIAAASVESGVRSDLLTAAEAVFAQWREYKDAEDLTTTQLFEALRIR